MVASFWSQSQIHLSEVAWVVTLVSCSSKLYDLILDASVLELRDCGLEYVHLATLDPPKESLIDLLRKSRELSSTFVEHHQCLQAVCHYHCHEGQGIMSEKECSRNTEAGYNLYHNHNNLKQLDWEG